MVVVDIVLAHWVSLMPLAMMILIVHGMRVTAGQRQAWPQWICHDVFDVRIETAGVSLI